MKKRTHGGSREGAGRKSQNKKTANFSINESTLTAFKKRYPRKASARVQELMEKDLGS